MDADDVTALLARLAAADCDVYLAGDGQPRLRGDVRRVALADLALLRLRRRAVLRRLGADVPDTGRVLDGSGDVLWAGDAGDATAAFLGLRRQSPGVALRGQCWRDGAGWQTFATATPMASPDAAGGVRAGSGPA